MRRLLLSLAAFCCLGASSCNMARLAPDSAMAAMAAGDATVIIEGCGSQPVVGYTYCRVTEGDVAGAKLRLHLPPAACKEKPCVTWKVFFPNGEPALGGAVPDGQTAVDIAWVDLIKKPQFSVGDRGFWPVLVEVHWHDREGRPLVSFAEGEIRLRVLRKAYTALNEIPEDRNFAWKWTSGQKIFKYTTAMRAYTGQVKK